MRRRRKRADLADRLRLYVNPGPPPEPMVDADPIRMFLFRWMIETGDPIEVVAQGFDVEPELLRDIADRRMTAMPAHLAVELSERLGLADAGT